MKKIIISLMQQAVHTLDTQWSIEAEHLQNCKLFFNKFEMLLENWEGRFEEEHEDDGESYTYKITLRLSDGYFEYLSISLMYYNEPDQSLQIYHSVKLSRDKTTNKFIWNMNFDENKQLYFIGLDDWTMDFEHKHIWAYKYGKKWEY